MLYIPLHSIICAILSGCQTQTTFTASQGFISSPNYPNDYPTWVDCFYTISLAAPSSITITFNKTFWVEASYDYVQVFRIILLCAIG